MRLYNQASCTPVGSSHYAQKKSNKWSPPQPYVPKRAVSVGSPPPEQRSCTTMTRTTMYARGVHPNGVRDTTASPCYVAEIERMSTPRTITNVGGLPWSRTHRKYNHGIKTPQDAAVGPGEWHSTELSRISPVRQRSTAQTTESPFVVLPKNPWSSATRTFSFSPPRSSLQPRQELRVVANSEKNDGKSSTPANAWDEFVPSLAAMSLITEHGEGKGEGEEDGDDEEGGFQTSIPKLSPTESSSVGSTSSTWLDFSLDGSENPFQQDSTSITPSNSNRTETNKTHFSPIEKAKTAQRQALVMTVKPTPVHKTNLSTTSYCLFPSQHSRQCMTSFSNVAKETSAFVAPNGTRAKSPPFWNQTMHPRNGDRTPGQLASRPATASPSSGIMETIIFSRCARCGDKNSIQLEQAVSLKSLMDLSKYCRMLKAGVPFENVLCQMELEEADGAIIELATAAANHAGNR